MRRRYDVSESPSGRRGTSSIRLALSPAIDVEFPSLRVSRDRRNDVLDAYAPGLKLILSEDAVTVLLLVEDFEASFCAVDVDASRTVLVRAFENDLEAVCRIGFTHTDDPATALGPWPEVLRTVREFIADGGAAILVLDGAAPALRAPGRARVRLHRTFEGLERLESSLAFEDLTSARRHAPRGRAIGASTVVTLGLVAVALIGYIVAVSSWTPAGAVRIDPGERHVSAGGA
jgi:hypothetical protein